MASKAELPFQVIEAAVEKLLAASADGSVTAAALQKELAAGKSKALQARIERILENDGRFFSDETGVFRRRGAFFQDYEFLVTPDIWEIENDLLLPGHRFAPYVSPDVFPSEIELTDAKDSAIDTREFTAPLSQVFQYHLLLGSEQVFDFFIAESPANARLKTSAQPGEPVTLNAFDLTEFYRKSRFSFGDALLCRVLDFDTGRISFRHLPGDKRRQNDTATWITAFETALGTVIDRFETYPEIPEQLSWACFCGAATLPKAAKSASLDEFIHRTMNIEINFDSDHTVLARKSTASADDAPEPPEGIGISAGETGDLARLLQEIGSPLTPVEIDSFILDNCHMRELEFEDFFARAFGRGKLSFSDEGQQAAFQNYIEDRFEELTGNYNRYDDEPKAPLRSTVMELVEDKLKFLDFLNSVDGRLEELPQDEVRRLAGISLQLNEILKLLNNPGFTPEAAELDRIAETVEARTDDQDALIATLTDRFADEDGRQSQIIPQR